MIKQVKAQEIKELMMSGECQVIDVREFSEFEAERIHNARLMPLSNFEKHAAEIDREKPVYLLCRSGNRARQAAERLLKKGFSDVHVVEGGMQAWEAANLPVVKGESRIWSLERQVRFAAGSIVLLGILLSIFLWQPFVWLSAFVGAGLVFSAATNTCGMALLLARLPWNQSAASCEVK